MTTVTVVIPTYNEVDNLPLITQALLALPIDGLRVLVVDDDSPDGTGKVADELAAEHPGRVSVIHRPGREGLGRAYVQGLTAALEAGAGFVVQMDADFSHPVDAVPRLLGTAEATGAACVIGSRYVPGGTLASEWSRGRRALSAWANFYVRTILRIRLRDVTAGFKIWRAGSLAALDLGGIASGGYSFQVEMHYRATRAGMTIIEIPIHFSDRRAGASKMSLRVQLESALMPWRLRFKR
ncbi:polyprenol monophosphomannose synthase [Spongiactinospora gelatinilytica]|uniref:Polyprenol monophosphomannose synthase n=1 Tax=Spongiactinospora gelatinilytica TaxID=2666298 RepID=A0A2W2FYG7_9ACTN|nr:polyprenol monophosphomannose synthase [Spongiactinospora gelatinilytica]PZG35169.1 polyprenol monophosphomannose synthase [Spongiactinospora gelatinilytica]